MPFTDDALKRLKEDIPKWREGNVSATRELWLENLDALLARLEAAEECLELPHMTHTNETQDTKCTFCTRYITWRKAKGE
jgi:hypothetical protein